MTGRTLGHFHVLKKLGAGGMGEVYLAEDTNLKRQVALKVLPPELAGSQERLERFQREAEILAALEHPSIVTIYSVEQLEGLRFLTMEYVEGEPLSRIMTRQGFAQDRFFAIAVPLADAIAAAHEKGIVHRDLKPSNVMVTRDGRVKVLDFGLGKIEPYVDGEGDSQLPTEALTTPHKRLGTLPYMSPEQVRGDPVDHRSDIFSLGVLLYQIVSGRYPFDSSSSADLASSILRDTPPSVDELRTGLPHHLGRIIRQCLEKKPEKRLQSAKDLKIALEDLHVEISTSGVSGLPHDPAGGRYRTWAVVLGVLLLAVLGLAGWGWFATREDPSESPAAERPRYVAIEYVASLADNPTGDHYRSGVLWVLQQRLQGLSNLYVVPDPEAHTPDFVLQTDTRRAASGVSISYRLQDLESRTALGGEILTGSEQDLSDLLDRLVRSVAAQLSAGLEEPLSYKAPPGLPRDAEVIEQFMIGLHLLDSSDGQDTLRAAAQAFEAGLRLEPGFGLGLTLLGLTLQRLVQMGTGPAELSQSRDLCEEALRLEPDLGLAWYCHGEAYRLAERFVDAVGEYARALDVGLRDPEVFSAARRAFTNLGRPDSEERFWREVIRKQPGFWRGYEYLGLFYLDRSRYPQAIEQYQRAINLAPTDSNLHTGLFAMQFELGRYGESIDTLERSLALNPEDHRAWGNLGHVYFLLRRFDEAIPAFERALSLESADHRSHGYMGRAYYWVPGRRQESTPHLERAVEICQAQIRSDPDNAISRILLAWYQAMLGESEASRGSLSRALELRPNDAHLLFMAGLIENLLLNEDEAMNYLERAVAEGWGTAELRLSIEVDNLRAAPRFQTLLRSE